MAEPIADYLPWDSAFFGLRIGRARPTRLTPAATSDLLAWARAERLDCLYLLAEADDPATFRLASRAGFDLIDVRMAFQHPGPFPSALSNPLIRRHQAEDLPALRELAAEAHREARFFADSRFPAEAAARLYGQWLERDAGEGAVFVVDRSGRPAGYISARLQDGGTGEIGVIALAAAERGLGMGRELVNAALAWCSEQGAAEVTVVTQGRNIQAQRLYQSAGFRTRSVQLWYHLWPERGAT